MRSIRKTRHSHEVRFWADSELYETLVVLCHLKHKNMPDLIEWLVRQHPQVSQ